MTVTLAGDSRRRPALSCAGTPCLPRPDGERQPPLISMVQLRELERELDSAAACRTFVRNFVELWESRCGRLADALAAGDLSASLDAVLSLKISSSMAGGPRLSALAEDLEKALRHPSPSHNPAWDHGLARRWLGAIISCGRETMLLLVRDYLQPES